MSIHLSYEQMQKESAQRVKDQLTRVALEADKQYVIAIKNIENQLKDLYADLSSITPDQYYNYVSNRNRLKYLLKTLKEEYTISSQNAEKMITTGVEVILNNTYFNRVYQVSWLADTGQSIEAQIPKALVDIIVYSKDEAWGKLDRITRSKIENKFGDLATYYPKTGTLTEMLYNNRSKELARISDILTQGLATGQSYTKMINLMKDAIGRKTSTKDGISLSGARANAARIVRTEGNRTANAATQMADMSAIDSGMKIKKMWVATLDGRTRDEHAAMDGEIAEVDATFSNGSYYPPSGPNCRCTTATLVDGVKPSIRMGRNPVTNKVEAMNYADYEQWFENVQTKDKVRKINEMAKSVNIL